MSALESLIAASGESNLQDGLDFSLPPSSTAIVDKQTSCRAYPTSASSLSPTGTRTCRIRLGGDSFVDPSTVRLRYTIVNNDSAKKLAPISGPWACWSLVRELVNGVESANIPIYGRLHEQFGWRLLTTEQQHSEAMYGWHSSYDGSPHPSPGFLNPGASLTVSHKLITPMMTSGKFLSLRYAPIDYELTVTSNSADWLYSSAVVSGSTVNYSTNYSITNIQLYYTASILDESVQEAMYRALLSNRVLNTPIQQCFQIVQSIPSGSTNYSFSVVRAFSKLTHVWISFRGTGSVVEEFLYPSAMDTAVAGTYGAGPVFSNTTDLPAPSIRLSLGAKNWPQFEPIQTVQEHYWSLMEALPATPFLDRQDYQSNTFMSCFDLRRTQGDATSAYSTRQGDQLRATILNLQPWTTNGSGAVVGGPTEVHITLMALGVLATRESGCQILD